MENVKIFALLACALALVLCLAASPSSAALPKNHEDFLKNEDYKNAFEEFAAVMAEAKERLSSDEYKAIEKENGEAISDDDDQNVITITFDGEIAKLTSSQAFKDSGWLGANVIIDGEYLREKK